MQSYHKPRYQASKYNQTVQHYKHIPLKLIVYTEQHFSRLKAKRFVINGTHQNVWIPNRYLMPDGTIKPDANLDFVFRNAGRKLELAGIKPL